MKGAVSVWKDKLQAFKLTLYCGGRINEGGCEEVSCGVILIKSAMKFGLLSTFLESFQYTKSKSL